MASTQSFPQAPEPTSSPEHIPAVAPAWHTAIVIVIVIGLGLLQATPRVTTISAHLPSRMRLYIGTLLYELFLLGLVWLGIWLRGVKLQALIGGSWARWKNFWVDVGIAFVFWLAVLGMLTTLSLALHFNGTEAASFLLPQTVPEMIVWVLLATSAGFCEELIFRGYLQRQCLALTQNVAAAVILQGLIFGAAHAYQGAKGVIVISVYGMMFGALAAMRKSLRPGMMQHATQDIASGLLGHLAKAHHLMLLRF